MKIVTENGELDSVILNKQESLLLARLSGQLSIAKLKELGIPTNGEHSIHNWYNSLYKFIPQSER